MSGFLLVLSVRPEVSGFLPLISEGGRPPYLYILLSRKSCANFDGGATGLHLCRILRHQRFTSPVNCLSQKMHSWLFVQSKLFFHSKNTQQVSNKEEGTLGVQMCVGGGAPFKKELRFSNWWYVCICFRRVTWSTRGAHMYLEKSITGRTVVNVLFIVSFSLPCFLFSP